MSDEHTRMLVFHALRLTSLASIAVISQRSSIEAASVQRVLVAAAAAGDAVERTGRLSGWSLTSAGRAEGERLLAIELAEVGARPIVESAYELFLTHNPRFLEVCTEWQLRNAGADQVPNDHTDRGYDDRVVGQLGEIHHGVCEVLDTVTVVLGRFSNYLPRFEHALGRLLSNDVDWFTKPLIDSYHTVWFELHEDLLATLGRNRGSER